MTLICLFPRLLEVRGRLYELLTHCIPADIIMKVRQFLTTKIYVSLGGTFKCTLHNGTDQFNQYEISTK